MRTPLPKQEYQDYVSLVNIGEEYEALFSIYTNEYGMLQFNLLKQIYISDNLPDNTYVSYHTSENESWTGLSYLSYNTVKLWWALYLLNSKVNPSPLDIQPGINLKIPSKQLLQQMLQQIKSNRLNEIR